MSIQPVIDKFGWLRRKDFNRNSRGSARPFSNRLERGRLQSESEAKPKGGMLRVQSILFLVIIVVSIGLAAWGMVTVSTSSQIPPSAFVTMPNDQLSTVGDRVSFVSVSDVGQRGLAVGVQGFLKTVTGTPVAGAKVYISYYAQGSYRTQVATTDQNGHFQALFPVNWTGWLPVSLTYFGDGQHQGLRQTVQVAGEGP